MSKKWIYINTDERTATGESLVAAVAASLSKRCISFELKFKSILTAQFTFDENTDVEWMLEFEFGISALHSYWRNFSGPVSGGTVYKT